MPFVLVSDWQRELYRRAFGIDAGRAVVLRNGVSPAFEKLFPRELNPVFVPS